MKDQKALISTDFIYPKQVDWSVSKVRTQLILKELALHFEQDFLI